MSNQNPAFIWIDHRVAKVFHANAETSAPSIVHSNHPHQHLHHKANSIDSGHARVDKDFLERVATAVARADAILITGPASAKTELKRHLEDLHPRIAANVTGVQTLDHPSDGQLLAHARRFFEPEPTVR